jgi:cation transport regulator ChaC
VANVKAEATEIEHLLKISFKEEQEANKIETFTFINNIKNELMNEQSRRQQLQAHLSESESQFFNQIQKLEEKNLFLQNKIEQADLEAVKSRMSFLHSKTSDSL